MLHYKLLVLVIAILVGLGMTGCRGGGAEVKTQSYSTTLGQELKDLEEAYNKGIISEKEYNRSKERLIEKRTER